MVKVTNTVGGGWKTHLQRGPKRAGLRKALRCVPQEKDRRRGRRMHPQRGVSTIPPVALFIYLDILMQAADANSWGQTQSSSISPICSSFLLRPINSTPLIKPLTGLRMERHRGYLKTGGLPSVFHLLVNTSALKRTLMQPCKC